MIHSMTGYGKTTGEFGGKTISVEIKSLNSKFFDLNLRLPQAYKDKEMELRTLLQKEAERGKMDVIINIETDPAQQSNLLNKDLIKALLKDLKEIKTELNLADENLLQIIMQQPQVVNDDAAEANEKEWELISKLIQESLDKFKQFRQREGKTLHDDIAQRINLILQLREKLAEHEIGRMQGVRSRLMNALKSFEGNIDTDMNRFEQELIYYLEKLDITEEKVRLLTHCNYFLTMLNDANNNGKKLGFIMQEIGREINTIGSKANDAGIQRIVVEMKDEAEKIKEQLSNIL
ncbi:MAG: YicC family protein [Bacteroidetes bacterium]|nr:YicC family protein [Bacteroidota bacterium]MCW5931386.1 YicC family protein [Bacteroidota bacterium]